jgi:acetoin utilization protein AcuC
VNRRTALIISPLWDSCSFGSDHPFKVERHRLAQRLMQAYGLLALPTLELHPPDLPTDDDLLSFHTPDYLQRLKEFSLSPEPRADFRYGLGDAENPVFRGMYEWALDGVGGTLAAARLVVEEGYDAAFNMAGGWHHAHRSRASGFSYLNDAVIAIQSLLRKNLRVVYLDIDAHHGDGVQEAFYDTDKVLTISIHEGGHYFFPGTGRVEEMGEEKGHGYAVNIPLLPHSDDALFMKAFDEAAYPLMAAYDPDVIVTQIGADMFRTDPLSNLEITTQSYSYVLRKVSALRLPWVLIGGGGYDQVNVARAWTLALAEMNRKELSPRLPPAFVREIASMGYGNTMLLDAMHWAQEDDRNHALDAVEQSIRQIRQRIFPLLIGSYGSIGRQ